MKKIMWFDEIKKSNIPQVGGKGANLGELTSAAIPVPEGFMVTAQTYFHFLESASLKKYIQKELINLDHNDSKFLQEKSKHIQKAIMGASIPFDTEQKILQAYHQLPANNPLVAVRSSATAEDLPDASFAGQQSTYLNVKGNKNLLRAVQSCWASLFEPRAIFYRVEKGFDHMQVGIAVVIQRMIQADKSGILFTVEPLENNPDILAIEAGWGLGEAIVSGSITPDLYLVDKKTLEITEKEIHKQPWKIVRSSFEDKEAAETEDKSAEETKEKLEKLNEKIPIPPNQQNQQKLTKQEINSLAKISIAIEDHYQFPQDIEWAIEKDQIYIVQARPITTFNKKAPSPTSENQPQENSAKKEDNMDKQQTENKHMKIILKGSAAGPGLAAGKVRIITDSANIDQIQNGEILVGEMTTPDYVPAMKKAAAIITDAGGRTCHAAIVSRELGIPCVVGTEKATQILKNGDLITVNGKRGVVYSGNVVSQLKGPLRGRTVEEVAGAKTIVPAAITATKIYVNLAVPEISAKVAAKAVDGVGLLRAEFMIAGIGEHPEKMLAEGRREEYIEKLSHGIRTIAENFYPRPVVYRTTDFKTNEYRNLDGGEKFEPEETNPMMGFRGCARYTKKPEVFRMEIDTIKNLRAEGLINIWIMLPFVRRRSELINVLEMINKMGLRSNRDFKIWMMVEVPSNVLLIEEFCQLGIDGVSIGSNDLTQLILGVDRDNETVVDEFDERSGAVMLAIEKVIKACHKYGLTSSICGQAPSVYPEFSEKLVELGITSISANPDVIEQTRRIVASAEKRVTLKQTKKLLEKGLN